MRLTEIFRMVWLNLVENKSKVLLTSLGIIVGAATIVLVIAIGRGGQQDVADQFKNLNAGAIDVKATTAAAAQMEGMMGGMPGMMPGGMPNFSGGRMPSFGGGGMPAMGAIRSGGGGMPGVMPGGMGGSSRNRVGSVVQLDTDDVDDLAELVPGLDEVTILVSGSSTVYGGDLEEEMNATVVGARPNYQQVSNLELLYGNFITKEDDGGYVAVIGYGLAEDIFTYPYYAYGDYITIDSKNYRIIGVLDEMGAVSSGISSDEAVYIPYQAAIKYVFGSSGEPTITAVASDVSGVETAMANIETVLKQNHPNGYFDISDAGSAMEAATSSANTLAMLLFAVATIVFVVGGIGIMNVLFVSVKERTPEIGILKAIGCPAGTILSEFLLEAVVMGVGGGIVGVGAGLAAVPLIELVGMRLEPTLTGALLALVFAVFTAAAFGFYPAYKASRLSPIEALTLN